MSSPPLDLRGPPASGWSPTPLPHDDRLPAGFHVPYSVGPATCGFGVGLFAACDVPAETLLWKFKGGRQGAAGVNVWQFPSEAEARARLAELTPEGKVQWLEHVYLYEGAVNEIQDDGQLWNHAEAPNCKGGDGEGQDPSSSYARRDIRAGEELLDDYGLYLHPEWYRAMLAEHGVSMEYVTIKETTSNKDFVA